MSHESPIYCASTPLTVDAFKNRPCSLSKNNPHFIPPTTDEIKALRGILGFSQARLGDLVGKSYNKKGCKAVRRWETTLDKKEHNPIDYCAWQLMLLAAGVISIDERIDSSSEYKIYIV